MVELLCCHESTFPDKLMTLSDSMIYVVLFSLERRIPACLFEGGVGHDNVFDPSVNQQSVCLFKHTSFVSDSHGGQMD